MSNKFMEEYSRNVPENVEKIVLKPLECTKKKNHRKCQVAAYCRVSTDMDEQQGSIETQKNVYTEMIQSNPEWRLAGIYADEGISGTNAAGRPEFLRMVKDCEKGKIDLIITKSISRFARNTLECLTFVRHLQNHGTDILFENNHIDTRTAFSEVLLTVLAAFAQEESRSISENTKWGIRKRFENGIARWCKIYGYTKNEHDDYVIVPNQASVVKKIFELYEHGQSIGEIVKYLSKNKVLSPNGKDTWTKACIYRMLKNEKYAGDIMLQKYLTADHISHHIIKNPCTEVPAYYIENHHMPIIERKTFNRVQKIMDMQSMGTAHGNNNGKCIQYPFDNMLHCPYCGQPLYQRAVNVQSGSGRSQGWCCEIGEDACKNFVMRSAVIEKAVLEAYQKVDCNILCDKIRKSQSESVKEAAKQMLALKQKHPKMEKVEYYWLEDLVDKIEIGAHLFVSCALSESENYDRTITVFWKFGLKTIVPTGLEKEKDNPRHIAELYRRYLNRHKDTKQNAQKQIQNTQKQIQGLHNTVSPDNTAKSAQRKALQ